MSLDSLRPEEEQRKDRDSSLEVILELLLEQRLTNKYLERIVGTNLRDEIELGE